MDIGKEIKRRREARGMTINACAMLARVPWSRWKKWEDGTAKPSFDMLPRIAFALGCKVIHLLS